MSDNPQGTGAISVSDAVNSLLMTPETDKVEEERQEAEVSESVEDDAEITEGDNQSYTESYDDDEDDSDDTEESDEDDDYEDNEEQPVESTYRVKVDGEEIEVTLDEALQGYQRQQSYTKRSQELAEMRKAAEREAAEAKAARDYYAQQLQVAAQQIQQTIPEAEPDWVSLAREVTGEEYNAIKAEYDSRKANLSRLEQERQYIAQQQAVENQNAQKKYLESQRREMLERIPQWRDDERRDNERVRVIQYARNVGFSEEEVAAASDARAIELLYKAMQWDNLQKKTPDAKKRAKQAPKMAKAGTPKTKNQVASRSRQEALKRLNSERSVDAAVQYLMGNKT